MAFNLFKKKDSGNDDAAAEVTSHANDGTDDAVLFDDDAVSVDDAASVDDADTSATHRGGRHRAEDRSDNDEGRVNFFGFRKNGEKKGDKANKPRNKREMLASVFSESEPGAAVDVMRKVTNFVIPESIIPTGGYLVMILPTADKSFGGLSLKQNKDEDKGMIINLMESGSIEIAITPDLLADDALAIIPTEDTLERLNEFSLLRDARYFWGVAVTDPDTGELVICTVPPKRQEDVAGHLYESAAAISRADLDLVEVVDMNVVKVMYEIFMSDEPGYGKAGVLGTAETPGAIDFNLDVLARNQAAGTMPKTGEYIGALYKEFPLVDPSYDFTASTNDDEDEEAEDDVAEDVAVDAAAVTAAAGSTLVAVPTGRHAADDPFADATNTDTPTVDTDNTGTDVDADAQDTDTGGVSVVIKDEDTAVDDDAAGAHDDVVHDTDMGRVASAPVAANTDAGVALMSAEEQQRMIEQLVENLKSEMTINFSDEDVARIAMTQADVLQRMGVFDAANTSGVQSRVSQQLATTGGDENLDEALKRSFLDDDLGLSLDMTSFEQTFYGQVPQLTFSPYDSHTPWLNDQLEELVRTLNSELQANYMRRREVMREKFRQMMSGAVKDIVDHVSTTSEMSPYTQLQHAADRDRAAYDRNREHNVANHRRELQSDYDDRRNAYVQARITELGAEFDRQHRHDLDYQMRMAEADMQAVAERAYDAMISEINRKRREDSQTRLRLSEFEVLNAMSSDLEAMLEEEAADLANAVDVIKDYVDEKAKDDVMHADAINARLAQDTRVEEIRKDAENQIATAREQADVDVSRITDAMDLLRSEHEKFIADLKRDNEQRLRHADDRVKAVQDEREADRAHLATVLERKDEEKNAAIQAAQDEVAQMKANMEELTKAQKSDYTTIIIMMVVLSVVMLVAGVVLANAFF